MSKELHEAIMKISRLRYKFLKLTTDTNKRNNSKQRKLCKKILKNTKKSYLKILTLKKLLIIEVSAGLSHHYLPKIHQKMKKLTSLMIVKSYLVTRRSVRHLINFSLM